MQLAAPASPPRIHEVTTTPRDGSAAARAGLAATTLRTSTEPGTFTGGDATYSVPLPGDRTAWIFGDSFIGGVQPDGARSHDPTTFVRNSLVLQDHDGLRTVTGTEPDGTPVDAARPPGMRENRDGSLPDSWYWPGHGTTRGDELHVFMNRFALPADRTDPLAWDWRYGGTDLARFDSRTGALLGTTPLLPASDVLWGAAVLERGPHTYVYGAEHAPTDSTRFAHVARVPRDQLADPASWRFWDGHDWTADPTRSARIGARVSTQFGVVDAADGGALLVTQDGFDPAVRAWHAADPQGPFTGGDEVARIPDQPAGRHVYNAVPHPQFTDHDGLLVSYNVGGADFMADHTSYRPGFLRVPNDRLPGGGVAQDATPHGV